MAKTATPPSAKLGKKEAASTPIKKAVESLKATAAKIESAIPKATPKDKKVPEATTKVVGKLATKAEAIPDVKKHALKPAETKAPKLSGVEAALARIKKSANQAMASAPAVPVKVEVEEAEHTEQPVSYIPAKAKHGDAAHLLPAAMVRKPPTVVKKVAVTAPGKISLADLRDRMKVDQPSGFQPLFDAKAHLKK